MIRFSAGLVVVAIGVLIGGVATSKLSLVYVAIAVSAVALVVLAIGVALKREELFGGGPGLAPAGAGAGSGMPVGQSADAGDVRGSDGHVRQDQQPIHQKVPGPATAAFEAAAAAQAAAARCRPSRPRRCGTDRRHSADRGPGRGQLPVGNPPLAHRRTGIGQAPAARGRRRRRLADALAAASVVVRQPGPPDLGAPRARRPRRHRRGAAVGSRVSPRAWGSPDQSPAPTARAGSGPAAAELVRPAEPARRRPGRAHRHRPGKPPAEAESRDRVRSRRLKRRADHAEPSEPWPSEGSGDARRPRRRRRDAAPATPDADDRRR